MAATAGYGGAVLFASNKIAELNDWAVDGTADTVETTAFATAPVAKKHIPTLHDWTATCAGNLDMSDTTGQLVMFNARIAGTILTPKFSIDGGTHYYSGTAIVTAFSIKNAVAGKAEFNVTFQGDGATDLAYT